MITRRKSRRVLVLAAMAWLLAAGPGPTFAKDDQLPPTDDTKPWGPGCSPDYQRWCHDNLKNYAGQPCADINIYVRPDGKCQCDCRDKAGGINPGQKKKGPG